MLKEFSAQIQALKAVLLGALEIVEKMAKVDPGIDPVPKEPSVQGWEHLIEVVKNDSRKDALKIAMFSQCILESARGTSKLAKEHLNYAGLKYRKELEGLAEPVDYNAHDGVDTYCEFKSDEDFVAGYWAFIGRSPYAGWEEHTDSPEAYLSFIKSKGYAEDPNYVDQLKGLFDEARMTLGIDSEPEREDNGKHIDLGDDFRIVEPNIVKVKGVKGSKRGNFQTNSKIAKGLGVHFTAGAENDSNSDAINTLKYLVSRGLCCPVMDHDGTIYVPEDWDIWRDWGYNFGASKWKGQSSVSRLAIGMEIVNAGRLEKYQGSYYPYYFLKKNSKGQVIGTKGPAHQSPRMVSKRDNMQAGAYDPYTPEQERSLFNFALNLRVRNKDFTPEWFFGHDEVATPLGRKNDPGGSLSMTMPEARAKLKAMIERLEI